MIAAWGSQTQPAVVGGRIKAELQCWRSTSTGINEKIVNIARLYSSDLLEFTASLPRLIIITFSRSLNCCLSPVGANQYPVSWSEVRRLGTLSKMRLLDMRLDRIRPGLFFCPSPSFMNKNNNTKRKRKLGCKPVKGKFG